MHKLSHRIALLAFAGTMVAAGPALAAPQNSPNQQPPQQPADFCSLPENANAQQCLPGADNHQHRRGSHDNNGQNNNGGQDNNGQGGDQHRGGGQPPTPGGSAPTPPDNNNQQGNRPPPPPPPPQNGNQPPPPDNRPPPPPPPPGMNGPPPNGFNWSQRDRDYFDRQFHGFNFGFFAAPGFSIHLGVNVPRSYGLKPVPRSIYRDYPQFRGYLFFVTRRGDVVIVSPKSHRIVAIL